MPRHIIVDGSNLATEGRTKPSLQQLVEAVRSYMEDHPDDLLSIVVDATFGHRIDPHEVADFETAIENNELVTPPAGAVGRGDAFVLAIAKKVKGTIISNDSYQEFHGDHPWLFEDGRLVGGKPVPHIGWVFVARTPVRGPLSRRSVKDAKTVKEPVAKAVAVASPAADGSSASTGRRRGRAVTVTASISANEPMPTPKAPPPGRAKPSGGPANAPQTPPANQATPLVEVAAVPSVGQGRPPAASADTPRRETVNSALAFIEFVSQHPVGTVVEAIVESYSSHGAYVRMGDVVGYAPLRLMGDPAPRSAREAVRLGDTLSFAVDAFHPTRRSIDLALRPKTGEPVSVGAVSAGTLSPGEVSTAAKAEPVAKSRRGRTAAKVEPSGATAAAVLAADSGEQSGSPVEPDPAHHESPATPPKRGRRTKASGAQSVIDSAPEVAVGSVVPNKPAKTGATKAVTTKAGTTAIEPAEAAVAASRAKPNTAAESPKPTKRSTVKASPTVPTAAAETPNAASVAPGEPAATDTPLTPKPTRKRASTGATPDNGRSANAVAPDSAPTLAPPKPRRAGARTKKAE